MLFWSEGIFYSLLCRDEVFYLLEDLLTIMYGCESCHCLSTVREICTVDSRSSNGSSNIIRFSLRIRFQTSTLSCTVQVPRISLNTNHFLPLYNYNSGPPLSGTPWNIQYSFLNLKPGSLDDYTRVTGEVWDIQSQSIGKENWRVYLIINRRDEEEKEKKVSDQHRQYRRIVSILSRG